VTLLEEEAPTAVDMVRNFLVKWILFIGGGDGGGEGY